MRSLLESNHVVKLSTPRATNAQHTAIMINAGISLSNFKLCSNVMAKYPITNTIIITDSIFSNLVYNNCLSAISNAVEHIFVFDALFLNVFCKAFLITVDVSSKIALSCIGKGTLASIK